MKYKVKEGVYEDVGYVSQVKWIAVPLDCLEEVEPIPVGSWCYNLRDNQAFVNTVATYENKIQRRLWLGDEFYLGSGLMASVSALDKAMDRILVNVSGADRSYRGQISLHKGDFE